MPTVDRDEAEVALGMISHLARDASTLAFKHHAIVNLMWAGWNGMTLGLVLSPQSQSVIAVPAGFAAAMLLLAGSTIAMVWTSRILRPFALRFDRPHLMVIVAGCQIGLALLWLLRFGYGHGMLVDVWLLGHTIGLGYAVAYLVWGGGIGSFVGLGIVFVVAAIGQYGGSGMEKLGWVGIFGAMQLAACLGMAFRERRP
jgi:hypothetical protein